MDTMNTRHGWQRGTVIGLAVLSCVVPVATIFLGPRSVPAIFLGLAGAVAAFIGARSLHSGSARTLSLILAILGVLIGAYVLWLQIGLCGIGVLGGRCEP